MKNLHVLKAGVACAAVGLVLCSGQAFAADADTPAASSPASTDTIVVTGTRIVRPNLQATSPLSSVTAEDIKLRGVTDTADILSALPQAYAEQGNHLSISSTGIATVNLRNLGPSRTLVLVNGRRLMPGDPTQPVADLNNIPAALIKRVDVVTGGGSSVYGSDAVAGVVNFIMDTKFTGVQLDLDDSFNWDNNNNRYAQGLINDAFGKGAAPTGSRTDGVERGATLTLGSSLADDKGHIVAFVGYHESHPVTQNSRDYSYCAIDYDPDSQTQSCGGSSTAYPTNLDVTNPADGTKVKVGIDGTKATRSVYNYAAVSYQQRQYQRYTGGVFADYEVNEHFDPYIEFMMTDDQSNAQFGPSGAFGDISLTLPCNGGPGAYTTSNPLIPSGLLNNICQYADGSGNVKFAVKRRNVEGGGRVNDFHHTSYRMVAGLKGKIDDVWSYDLYGQYGHTEYQQVLSNYLSISKTRDALNVGGTAANPVCTSGNAGCVPWDIWNDKVTPAALAYIASNPIFNGSTTEKIVSGSLNGTLDKYGIKTPWAGEGVGIALGAEYRSEGLISAPDSLFSSGDVAGLSANPAPLNVKFTVKEVFGEAHIPLADNQPLIKHLSLDASYRYSDYSTSGSASAYKFGLEYAPASTFTFRTSFNRAVRAPNLLELYSPTGYGLWSGIDPCSGPTPRYSAEQCARTGLPVTQYGKITNGTSAQNDLLTGGNAGLRPEKSNTLSLGFVFQPEGPLKGLALTVDWFKIDILNYINQGLSAPFVIASCATNTGPVASDPYCGKIHRSDSGEFQNGDGSDGIDGYWLNTGKVKVSGIDVSGSYRLNLTGAGRITWDLNGTYMGSYRNFPLPGSSVSYNCAGFYGVTCATPVAKWRHTLRTTWYTPWNVNLSLNWRYFGPVKNDAVNPQPLLQNPGALAATDLHIGAYNYFDLAATWKATQFLTVRAGINNIFDKHPPLIDVSAADGTYANGNTYPGVYDPLGRLVHFSATVKF